MNEIKNLPLTQNQTAIWLDEVFYGASSMYNIGAYYEIKGDFNPAVFSRALERAILERDSLGISIRQTEDGQAEQVFRIQESYVLPMLDFSGEGQPVSACEVWMDERFQQPFDISTSPLYDFALLKAGDGHYFWLMKMHHLIVDGWGFSVFTAKLSAYYNGMLGGLAESQPVFSYSDYVSAEVSYHGSEGFARDRDYWLEKLKVLPGPLREVRTVDNMLQPVSKRQWKIPRGVYGRVEAYSAQQNVSVFHFWLGILATYLYRSTGQGRFCIGIPVVNRANRREKGTVGLFTGVSPLLVDISADMRFEDLLNQIKSTLRQDYRHQRYPIQELVRRLRGELGDQDLYEVGFSYMQQDMELPLSGTNACFKMQSGNRSKMPLDIWIEDFSKEGDILVDYYTSAGHYPEWEVDAMLSRMWVLMETVLAEAHDQPLGGINILPQPSANCCWRPSTTRRRTTRVTRRLRNCLKNR
jgi:hypothetical protein